MMSGPKFIGLFWVFMQAVLAMADAKAPDGELTLKDACVGTASASVVVPAAANSLTAAGLNGLGFSATGPIQGSLAAAWMSSIASTGGAVASGTIYSVLQSTAMTIPSFSSLGAGVGVAAGAYFYPKALAMADGEAPDTGLTLTDACVGTASAVVVVPAATNSLIAAGLYGLGFSATGPIQGSLAAAWMSSIASTGGAVASGTIYSMLQSTAMTITSFSPLGAAVGVGAGAYFSYPKVKTWLTETWEEVCFMPA